MCHMFLYVGRKVWHQDLQVKDVDDSSFSLSIQCWTCKFGINIAIVHTI